jgi:hypothetical protein
MQVWTDEQSGKVNWLRKKHYGRKVGREGFSTPAKSGNGAKKRIKHKAPDRLKQWIYASQPKKVKLVQGGTGKYLMVVVDKT